MNSNLELAAEAVALIMTEIQNSQTCVGSKLLDISINF